MLQDLIDSERRVERLRGRIRQLECELMRVTPRMAGITSASDFDKLASGVAEIVDLEQEILRRIASLERERLRIDSEIDRLPAQQRRVINARYMDGWGWGRIARETHYDKRHLYRIHRAALKRLGEDD